MNSLCLIGSVVFFTWSAVFMDVCYAEYKVVCNKQKAHLLCKRGEVIIINWAHFGRRDSTTCGKNTRTDCTDENSLSIVNGKCAGRQECRFTVRGSLPWDLFKNRCFLVPKYLEIDYKCVKEVELVSICNIREMTLEKGFLANPHYPVTVQEPGLCTTTVVSSGEHSHNITVLDFQLSRCSLRLKSGSKIERYCDTIQVDSDRTFISIHSRTVIRFQAAWGDRVLIEYSEIKCLESDLKVLDTMNILEIKENDYVILECKDGYKADNTSEVRLQCRNNQWEGSTGHCRKMFNTTEASKEKVQAGTHHAAAIGVGIAATILILLGVLAIVLYLNRGRLSKNKKLGIRNRAANEAEDARHQNFYMQLSSIDRLNQNESPSTYETMNCNSARNTNNTGAGREDTGEDSYEAIKDNEYSEPVENTYDYAWVGRRDSSGRVAVQDLKKRGNEICDKQQCKQP